MADKFTVTGWRRVRDQVGQGRLVGKLKIDQVYAKYQHERLELVHPRGGGPKYLEAPFYANHGDYLRRIASGILEVDPAKLMAECMESLNTRVSAATPIELNNLRRSGNPQVIDNGSKVYDRAPWQRRLSKEELRSLRRGNRRGRRF